MISACFKHASPLGFKHAKHKMGGVRRWRRQRGWVGDKPEISKAHVCVLTAKAFKTPLCDKKGAVVVVVGYRNGRRC